MHHTRQSFLISRTDACRFWRCLTSWHPSSFISYSPFSTRKLLPRDHYQRFLHRYQHLHSINLPVCPMMNKINQHQICFFNKLKIKISVWTMKKSEIFNYGIDIFKIIIFKTCNNVMTFCNIFITCRPVFFRQEGGDDIDADDETDNIIIKQR